jgi:peptidoglycan/xylan/chitin deacetylase (PgdA/CDA1 family)
VPSGVALTFDDGPHPDSTPRVLDLLAALDVTATFFLVGEQVRRSNALAREIAERGHAIACHGYHHRNHLARTPGDIQSDLVRACATIEDATGHAITKFRPPYGVFNAASWRACAELGWDRVLWSRWARDWEERATPESITARCTDGLTDGEILLLHDADTYSARGCYEALLTALPRIVAHVRGTGLDLAALA